MDSEPPEDSSNSSYRGYRYYGGYGYNYGGYDAEPQEHRSLKDYIIIFRERFWLFLFCFAIIITGVLLYTLKKPKEYKSVAELRMERFGNTPIDTGNEKNQDNIGSHEDFNTWANILKSPTITSMVETRLKASEVDYNNFMEPYQKMDKNGGRDEEDPIVAGPILHEKRRIIPKRLSLVIQIEYIHPNPEIAATVVNHFAQSFREYQLDQSLKKGISDISKLGTEIQEKEKDVLVLEAKAVNYKTQFTSLGLDSEENIFLRELTVLREHLIKKDDVRKAVESRWQQLLAYEAEGRSLLDLGFISNTTHVATLVARNSLKKEELGLLAARYRSKHPKMLQALQAQALVKKELDNAILMARNKAEAEHLLATVHYKEAQRDVAIKEQEYLALEKNREEYGGLTRKLEQARKSLEHLRMLKFKEDVRTDTKNSSVNIYVDGVAPTKHFTPSLTLNLAFGTIGGAGFGLFMVFFTAFIDNRVKSPFDIEQVIKLPLVGVIPQIRKLDSFKKARIIESAKDNHVKEAFRSIFSTLGVNDASKDAQVILNTSTIPGEGKSFVSTNLAFTYAESGNRVLLLDCDLRLPNIAKSLQLELTTGLLDYVQGTATLEEVIVPGVFTNLDILPAGGRSRTPMTIFNNEYFPFLMNEIRQYYDKIIIDSPPLAAVSDALNIVPFVDGILFVVKYNTVKRNTASLTVRKLAEAGKPIFGVILNNMASKSAEYYYSEYYTGQYKKYYTSQGAPEVSLGETSNSHPKPARKMNLEQGSEAQA